MHFKKITAEEIVLTDDLQTQGTVEVLADGQLFWQPYLDGTDPVTGDPILIKETTAEFRFGRSSQVGAPSPGTDDGLLMEREINSATHSVFLGVHPDVPNVHVASTKTSADVPYMLCTDSAAAQKFAIKADGTVLSAGIFDHDFSSLPDSYAGSSVHGASSVYIGSACISDSDTRGRLETYRLREAIVPLRLQSAPYNFTVSDITPGRLNLQIHEWLQLARQAHSPHNFDLKVSDIFPAANFATDFERQERRLQNDEQLRHEQVDGTGTLTGFQCVLGRAQAIPYNSSDPAAVSPERDGIHVGDAGTGEYVGIYGSDTLPSLRIVSNKQMTGSKPVCRSLEVLNPAGEVLFAVDQNGMLSTLGWDSLDSGDLPSISLGSAAFHDASVYIGDARFSWDRAARTMHLDRLKNTGIPAYLVAQGFTANDMPASHPAFTDLGAHGWLALARDFTNDHSLQLKDVFPPANSDWEAITFVGSGGGGGGLGHTESMVNASGSASLT